MYGNYGRGNQIPPNLISEETRALLRQQFADELRKSKRWQRWFYFGMNVFFFLLFGAISIALLSAEPGLQSLSRPAVGTLVGALVVLFAGWGSGLLMHFFHVLTEAGVFDKYYQDRMIVRELGKQLINQAAQSMVEKPKRSAGELHLSDDGELIATETPAEEEQKRTRDAL